MGEKFFLLTHDYLVPSIREWLTRKQKETRRGRAELRLAERSRSGMPNPRTAIYRPLEWANIRLLTRKKDWTEPQRKMMRRAGRVHGLRRWPDRLISLTHWGGIEGYGTLRTSSHVRIARTASTEDVPAILYDNLTRYRRWAIRPAVGHSRLKSEPEGGWSRKKLHASLALLPVDATQVDYLFNRLLNTTATELPVIRDALKPTEATLIPKLWSVLDSAKPGDVSLLRAASALADYDDNSPRWEAVGGKVAEALVTVNPVYLGHWLDALLTVRIKLTTPLVTIFRDKNRPEIETHAGNQHPDRLRQR